MASQINFMGNFTCVGMLDKVSSKRDGVFGTLIIYQSRCSLFFWLSFRRSKDGLELGKKKMKEEGSKESFESVDQILKVGKVKVSALL